jgi:ribosomal protein L7/L12
MSKVYKEAIDVLAWDGLKPAEMLRQLAKDNPGALVRAARCLGYRTTVTLESRVREMMKTEGMLIEAIRLVRNERHLGLKEAKDFVEALAP